MQQLPLTAIWFIDQTFGVFFSLSSVTSISAVTTGCPCTSCPRSCLTSSRWGPSPPSSSPAWRTSWLVGRRHSLCCVVSLTYTIFTTDKSFIKEKGQKWSGFRSSNMKISICLLLGFFVYHCSLNVLVLDCWSDKFN